MATITKKLIENFQLEEWQRQNLKRELDGAKEGKKTN
jgi:hypothetical protein